MPVMSDSHSMSKNPSPMAINLVILDLNERHIGYGLYSYRTCTKNTVDQAYF